MPLCSQMNRPTKIRAMGGRMIRPLFMYPLADEGQSHENHTVAETVGDTVNE